MIEQVIFENEKSLLDFPNRASVKFLDNILADDFIEVGSIGKRWTKSEIIERLKVSEPIDYELREFKISSLSDSVVLATYLVKLNNIWSFRSSIWVCDNNGWRMKYHQGTRTT